MGESDAACLDAMSTVRSVHTITQWYTAVSTETLGSTKTKKYKNIFVKSRALKMKDKIMILLSSEISEIIMHIGLLNILEIHTAGQ